MICGLVLTFDIQKKNSVKITCHRGLGFALLPGPSVSPTNSKFNLLGFLCGAKVGLLLWIISMELPVQACFNVVAVYLSFLIPIS